MITPEMKNHAGVSHPHPYARVRLFNAVEPTELRESEVADLRGFTKLVVIAQFAGIAAGTDLVGSLELLAGGFDATAIAQCALMGIAAANQQGPLPTGVTIDGEGDGLAIAATMQSAAPIILHFDKVPPKLAARLNVGSIAVPAGVTFTLDAYVL